MEKRWRSTIEGVVADGIAAGEIAQTDAEDFAITWAVLLDGLSIQVALNDPTVDPERAFDIAMTFAEQALDLPAQLKPPGRRSPSHKAASPPKKTTSGRPVGHG